MPILMQQSEQSPVTDQQILLKRTKLEVVPKDHLSSLCLVCRSFKEGSCKKGLVPKPKWGGGEMCKRFHEKGK